MEPGVEEEMGFTYPMNIEQMKDMFESAFESEDRIYLLITFSGEKAGQTGAFLELEDARAGIWIYVKPEMQGKGIGTRATEMIIDYVFNNYPVEKIDGNYLEGNEGSRKMQEKAGFKEETRLREHVYHQGKYKDLIHTSILREEWEARKKGFSRTEKE